MHFFALLAIAAMSSSARAFTINSLEEFDEWPRAVVGTPGTSSGMPNKCKKDVLIVLDTSYSITRKTFNEKVKPFLKSLIANSQLNVGPDGTQIGIIIFSNVKNTRDLLTLGEKASQADLIKFINDKVVWDDVSGDQTRTGLAFQIANDQIFPKKSPNNARPKVADVVIFLTDGEPRGSYNELVTAYKYAKALRDKDILIVGIAVGPKRQAFIPKIVKMVGSKDNTFDAEFDTLKTILDKLVDASCKPFKPGDCDCADVVARDFFVPPGQTTLEVDWVEPKLQCKNRQPTNLRPTVSPNVTSPHTFNLGHQRINYTYTIRQFPIKCYAEFNIFTCSCPSTSKPQVAYLKPGDSSVGVTWTVPKPSCPATETSVTPNVSPGTLLQRGKHTVNYLYRTNAGFDLTCSVNIEVKVCDCPVAIPHSYYVHPDNPTRSVSWTVPKPTCTGVPITGTTITPNVSPGHSFAIGRHNVRYAYDMQTGFTLTCDVPIQIKVVPCQGRDYDRATKICCCGKVWTKKPGWKCCGKKYHDAVLEKCCPLFYNLVAPSASCPGDDITS